MTDSFPSNINFRNNVTFKLYDEVTHRLISTTSGHNRATNSMLIGIAHYLLGDGIKNQGFETLREWLPQYISLGTMGLRSQECDEYGLPIHLGSIDTDDDYIACTDYMNKIPGFGADGYDNNLNNGRLFFGIGPTYENRPFPDRTVDCELLTSTSHRTEISFRELVTETNAELPKTIDVVLSAMISTGNLSKYREQDKDYMFITEAGLWCKSMWRDGGDNGLLAGYRIAPSDESHWDMSDEDNRRILRQSILRVGYNQVLQVIWKIQLGSLPEFSAVTLSRDKWVDYRNIFWIRGTVPSPDNVPDQIDSDEFNGEKTITFSSSEITTDASVDEVEIEGSTVYVKQSGRYVVRGSGEGNIIVNESGNTIILKDASITSDSSNTIEFMEGTNELLISGTNFLNNGYLSQEYSSAIYSKGIKTTILGDGHLNINSSAIGIYANRTLLIGNGSNDLSIDISSEKEGIRGTTVRMSEGSLNISSKYDGIRVDNEMDSNDVTITTPAFYISGGIVTIHSNRYGIYADEGNIHISDGTLEVYGGFDESYEPISWQRGCYWTGGTVFCAGCSLSIQEYTSGKYVQFTNLQVFRGSIIEIHDELNQLLYYSTTDRDCSIILYSESDMFGIYRLYVDGNEIDSKETITKTILSDNDDM